MTRKIINDMILPKKSIRQIPILADKKKKEDLDISRLKKSSSWRRKPLNPKFVIWLIAGICVLSLFFGLSIIFSSATIVVTPRIQNITFSNELYTARAASTSTADLSFEVLKVKQALGETILATENKEVSQKASGTIVIYNNYSAAPQRLINNTRFEANNGKIYRISGSVIVPGYRKSGNTITPGSIEATVYADQAGEEYNLKLADLAGDFKIPGFKGDPRYDGFYARLKTDILGGFVGKQMIVNADLRKTTENSLKEKLKEQLLKELYAVKPETYLFLKDGYSIDYVNQADSAVDSNQVKINIEGDLNAIVFNDSKLSKYIASKKITDFDGLPTEFIPADSLTATFIAKDNTGLWKNSTLDIKFTGEATIKWSYDGDSIKKDFAGKNEADLKNLIAKYKDSVAGIRIMFIPVWTRYVPDNLNRIKLKEG